MTQPRVVAILQARMSSTRLPGKVLMELGGQKLDGRELDGQPMLGFMAARLARARRLDAVVVATSDDAHDDPLAAFAASAGLACVRGPLADVLTRYHLAADQARADIIVRVTGDCPLIDPEVVDAVVALLVDGGLDYASNVAPPSFPDGLDCEAFTGAALAAAMAGASAPADREHVTTFIRGNPRFAQANHAHTPDLAALRWTVDYPADLAHVRALVSAVAGDPLAAGLGDYLEAEAKLNAMAKG